MAAAGVYYAAIYLFKVYTAVFLVEEVLTYVYTHVHSLLSGKARLRCRHA